MSEDLKQEITELENQLDGVEPEAKEEAAPDDNKEISTDNVVEKDGEIYLKDDSAEEKTEESVEQPTEESKVETAVEDPYKDKSREELISLINEKEKIVSEEKGTQQVQKSVDQMSERELFDEISGDELAHGLMIEKEKFSNMSPLDDSAAYQNQQKLINQLEVDLVDKRTQESLQSRFDNSANAKYIADYKDTLKGNGIDLSEKEYAQLVRTASNYKVSGKFDDSSMQKAMIDLYGPEKMMAYYTSQGEGKARNEIATASSKTHPKVDVSGSGKNAKLVRINDMGAREMNKQLDNLSVNELQALNRKLNKT